MKWHVLAAYLLCSATFSSEFGIVGALGLRLGIPQGPSAGGSAIIGPIEHYGGVSEAEGVTLLAEPGLGGYKLACGWSSLTASDSGPYVFSGFHDWHKNDFFIWPNSGWSVRAAYLKMWKRTLVGQEGNRFIGLEGEWITTVCPDSIWGGLTGCNLTIGVMQRMHGYQEDATNLAEDNHTQWLLCVALGVGF